VVKIFFACSIIATIYLTGICVLFNQNCEKYPRYKLKKVIIKDAHIIHNLPTENPPKNLLQ
jgi:hypothetical protein